MNDFNQFTMIQEQELEQINGGKGKVIVEGLKWLGKEVTKAIAVDLTKEAIIKVVTTPTDYDPSPSYYTSPKDGHFGNPVY